MSDTPNNPVMQQPQRAISRVAAAGIMAAVAGMTNDGRDPRNQPTQRMRYGKHHGGRVAGAFGRQDGKTPGSPR